MPESSTSLKFGRTADGFRLRVEGRGTMRESRSADEFVTHALEGGEGNVVVDLSSCTYLDSTFLGCLVAFHRRFGQSKPPRFFVAASPAVAHRLFGATRLDAMLHMIGAAPDSVGEEIALTPAAMTSPDFARHVMECHRQLAQVEGPQQKAFAAIAEQLSRELEKPKV